MFSIVLLKNKHKLFLQIVFLLHIFVLLQTMSSYCFQHWIGYICAVTDLTRALVTLHIPSPSFFTPCIHRAFYAVQYRTLCIVQTSLSPSCFTPTIPCNTGQHHTTPTIPCNTVQHRAITCNTVQYRALYIVQTSSRHRASHQQYTTCINRAFYAVHCPLYIVQTLSCTAVPS